MTILSYQIEIDRIDRANWESLISQFNDASLFQTWAFGSKSSKTRSVSHIVLRRGEDIIGCCQVRLRRFPILNIGFADISAGPLCLRKGGIFDPEELHYLVRKIAEEYGIRRGYLLRIWPHATGEIRELLKRILEAEGFKVNNVDRPYRTFRINLSPPLEELRLNLLQKWRNCLNKAEKNGLHVIHGNSDQLFKVFIELAEEMCDRKKISLGVDYNDYREIQKNLPESLKMRIMVCESGSEPVCAIICSAIGNTGIYHLGATGEKGLKLNSSYLLQWYMIRWMKENGLLYYDLGAFNPTINPGVYHFKKGLAGKKECEDVFLNEYDGLFSMRSRFSKVLTIRQFYRNKLESLRHIIRSHQER